MTIGTALALLGWGTLAGIDLISVPQIMIARPLVAGTVAGVIMGDPAAGALVGALLELFALEILPVGATRYPDYGPAAVAGAVTAAGAPLPLSVGIAGVVGLLIAWIGQWSIAALRRGTTADVHRALPSLDAGDAAVVRRVHWRGIARDTVRAAAITALGLMLAVAVRRWAPVSLRGAVLLLVVLTAVALAGAMVSAMRLAGGPRRVALWFGTGLLIGATIVALR